VNLRPPTEKDVDVLAKLIYDAFASIHDKHNFPRDFPSMEPAIGLANAWIAHPAIWGVVAERGGQVVGCNFLSERNPAVAGVGPVCVSPAAQCSGVGRAMMNAILERARSRKVPSVRLVQDAFNTVSMSLYTSCGFDVKEPLALVSGVPKSKPATRDVRAMQDADLPACGELCARVHGFDRTGELRDAQKMFKPMVLSRGGKVRAYASSPHFYILNHGVAETEEDMRELLLGAAAQGGGAPLALLVPIRRSEFFRWCLSEGLRVLKPMTLMSLGEYRDPTGAWYPSVEY
jgi:ribosomal protein S18 acetylase RimI-like enzyme